MARPPAPWYWEARDGWYVTIDKVRHKLAEGRGGKAEAHREFHRLMAGGQPAGQEAPPTLLVGEVCGLYIAHAEANLAPLTAEWYRRHLDSFMLAHGAIPADQVRPRHITAWTGRPEWGPSTRSGAITAVKRAFAWARKQGHIPTDPIKEAEKPAVRPRETILAADQAHAIDQAVRDPAFRDLLVALKETGARPSEVAAWEAHKAGDDGRLLCQVDLEAAVIRQWSKTSGRTRKLRQVHLTPRMVALLRNRIAEYPTGPLFRNTRGNPWTRNAMACRFARLRGKLGLGKEATAETYRHGFITDALERGVPIATVAELAGHASTAMISRHYSKLAQRHAHLKDALARIRPDQTPNAQPPPQRDGSGEPGTENSDRPDRRRVEDAGADGASPRPPDSADAR